MELASVGGASGGEPGAVLRTTSPLPPTAHPPGIALAGGGAAGGEHTTGDGVWIGEDLSREFGGQEQTHRRCGGSDHGAPPCGAVGLGHRLDGLHQGDRVGLGAAVYGRHAHPQQPGVAQRRHHRHRQPTIVFGLVGVRGHEVVEAFGRGEQMHSRRVRRWPTPHRTPVGHYPRQV